jgi:hypothetical protein
VKKKVEYGLGSMTASDYFRLEELQYESRQEIKKERSKMSLIKEHAVE